MRNELYNVFNELNNLFNDGGYKTFPIDVVEAEGGYDVLCEMPGIKKENVTVTFEEDTLTIEAEPEENKDAKYLIHERCFMKLKRRIALGDDIDADKFQAKFENGILIVKVFKKAPEVKPAKNIIIE